MYVNKQFKALGARAVDIIVTEYSSEIANPDDPTVASLSAKLLEDVQAVGAKNNLTLYNPRRVILINDDVHSIFRIFPNGVIAVSSVS